MLKNYKVLPLACALLFGSVPLKTMEQPTDQPLAVSPLSLLCVTAALAGVSYLIGKDKKASQFEKKTIRPLINIAAITTGLLTTVAFLHNRNFIEKTTPALMDSIFNTGFGTALGFMFSKASQHDINVFPSPQLTPFNQGISRESYAGTIPQEIDDIINYCTNPDFRKALAQCNVRPPKRLLLIGPSATGKTHLIRVIAHAHKNGVFALKLSDCIKPLLGQSEQVIKDIFEQINAEAKKHPSQIAILFMDEIDALGSARANNTHESYTALQNSLLTELDGLVDNNNVVVIGATNRYEVLDNAMKSRFPHVITMPPADKEKRVLIIKTFFKNPQHCYRYAEFEKNVTELAETIADKTMHLDLRALNALLEGCVMHHVRRHYNGAGNNAIPKLDERALTTIIDTLQHHESSCEIIDG